MTNSQEYLKRRSPTLSGAWDSFLRRHFAFLLGTFIGRSKAGFKTFPKCTWNLNAICTSSQDGVLTQVWLDHVVISREFVVDVGESALGFGIQVFHGGQRALGDLQGSGIPINRKERTQLISTLMGSSYLSTFLPGRLNCSLR